MWQHGSLISRRKALALLTIAGASAAMEGCGLRRPIGGICPDLPTSTELTIDVHAHVFNGTDLPVKQYLDLVAPANMETYGELVRQFGGILSLASWLVAPSGNTELRALQGLMASHQKCPPGGSAPMVEGIRQNAYSRARKELQSAARKRRAVLEGPTLALGDEGLGLATIEALPETDREFHSLRESSAVRRSPHSFAVTFGSAIDFVLEMFQYRYASYARYLTDFQNASSRHVDLVLSALVDYDWWLHQGVGTETKLPDQVAVMAQLAVASGGRLHYWAPFCPYREAQSRLRPTSTFSSLALVKKAVLEQGAMGVKIYPPMGFAPLGNESLDHSIWKSAHWLGGLAKEDRFGRELDISMRELFEWCISEDVPILAHANTSSGPSKAFSALAGPDHWQVAIGRYPGLRVVFGHFGGAENAATPANAESFIRLMSGPVARSSADVSYFSKALDDPQTLEAALGALLMPATDPWGVLPKRLLFGSDWKMLLLEDHAGDYLKDFNAVFQSLANNPPQGVDLRTFVADALGRNSIGALGLQGGGARGRARARLEAFYAANHVAPPQWMQKVDRLSALAT